MKIGQSILSFALGLTLAGSGTAIAHEKMETTAEEHASMAKTYRSKAESARKEADEHRKMAARYKDSAANAHAKGQSQPDPWVVKMESTAT